MRADEAWIRQVASDPTSDAALAKYGVALTPSETADLDLRTIDADTLKPVVVGYGERHPDEWAGFFVDQGRGGTLVVQFSGHVDDHGAAILSRVNPDANIEIREVRWSLRDLQAQAGRLNDQDAWFRTIPAVLMGYGIDTSANRVGVRISSAAPDAADRINEHFGWADVAIVVSDGTGALVLPSGTLKVVARNRAGKPVAHARCDAVPDLAGAYETPLPPPTTDSHGICQFTVPATGYWIYLKVGSGPPTVIGTGRGVVRPNEMTEVLIVTS